MPYGVDLAARRPFSFPLSAHAPEEKQRRDGSEGAPHRRGRHLHLDRARHSAAADPLDAFFLTSGALLASESSSLAHLLDRVELRLRSWVRAIRKKWRALTPAWKGVVGGVLLCVAAVKIYFIYRIYHYCRG